MWLSAHLGPASFGPLLKLQRPRKFFRDPQVFWRYRNLPCRTVVQVHLENLSAST